MTYPEHQPEGTSDPASATPLGEAREPGLDDKTLRDWYIAAEKIAEVRIEQYKTLGLLRRVEQLADEWEQDDHFENLARLHQQSCAELGLPWPPPPLAEQQRLVSFPKKNLPRVPSTTPTDPDDRQ